MWISPPPRAEPGLAAARMPDAAAAVCDAGLMTDDRLLAEGEEEYREEAIESPSAPRREDRKDAFACPGITLLLKEGFAVAENCSTSTELGYLMLGVGLARPLPIRPNVPASLHRPNLSGVSGRLLRPMLPMPSPSWRSRGQGMGSA